MANSSADGWRTLSFLFRSACAKLWDAASCAPPASLAESHMNRKLTRISLLALFSLLATLSASAEWKEKVLYSFQGNSDGAMPLGNMVFDKQGNLYGVTQDGGASTCKSIYQCGTVYQLAPPAQKGGAWTETVLHIFQGNVNNDGASPFGGLLIDNSGNLYGTTAYGGSGNCTLLGVFVGCGTVFELSPPAKKGDSWTETVLYNFQSGSDGYVPWGDLAVDAAGNLYGATQFGGGRGTNCNSLYGYCGTIFELSPPKKADSPWTEKVLYSFAGISIASPIGDGGAPTGGLVLDSSGAIYGTTYIGGFNCPHDGSVGCGTVFKLTPPLKMNGAWSESILHRFAGPPDGADPFAGVVFGPDNNLYGTTQAGGSGNSGGGTVFRLGGKGFSEEQVLYSFKGSLGDGFEPMSDVGFDAKGRLYGSVTAAGQSASGAVYRLTHLKNNWIFTGLYDFGKRPDGNFPASPLVRKESESSYFGTTERGGTSQSCGNYGCGTVFEVSP